MRITEDTLRMMGAEREEYEWVINCGGVHFNFKPSMRDGKQVVCNNGSLLWDMDGHSCSDMEEALAFAYKDGLRDGRNELKSDLRELLKDE